MEMFCVTVLYPTSVRCGVCFVFLLDFMQFVHKQLRKFHWKMYYNYI